MSLINQALHKAQRDRTPDRMAEPGTSGSSTTAPSSSSGMKPGLVIGLIVAVAVLLGLVAGLSMVLLKGDDSALVAEATPQADDPAPVQENPPTPPSEPTAHASKTVEPIAPPVKSSTRPPLMERETTPPVVEELRKAREAAAAKAAAEAKAAEEAAARAAAKPSQDIIDWLSHAQINGVKLSDAESKVILNGESYAVGEYVNYALDLKVLIIQEKRVLFIDKNGKKYMKQL